MITVGLYPGPMPPEKAKSIATPADARCPSVRVASPSMARAGTVARGKPPSPYIGAGTIVAMQWVVFGACILRWAMA